MGRHALPRERRSHRVAVVGAGTVLLTLTGTAAAFADGGPPLPVPVPQPVQDVVETVTDAAGLPNPLADAAAPQHARPPKAPHVDRHAPPSSARQVAAPAPARAVAHVPAAPVTPAATDHRDSRHRRTHVDFTSTVTLPGRAHSAPAEPQATVASDPVSLPADGNGRRGFLVALALLAAGGAAAGHVKVGQDRLARWTP